MRFCIQDKAISLEKQIWRKGDILNYAVMTVYRGLDGSANILSISGSVAN